MGVSSYRLSSVLVWCLAGGVSLAGICPGLDGGPGDFDGDGLPAAIDCDDADPLLQTLPGPAEALRVEPSALSWLAPRDPGGLAPPIYNLFRASDARFLSSSCIGTALDQPFALDADQPLPGGVFYYLVETANACGGGGVGVDSAGQPRAAVQCDCSTVCDDGDACTVDSCAAGSCVNSLVGPTIVQAPEPASSCDGGSVDFRVEAAGSGALSYAWEVNGIPIGPDAPTLRLFSLNAAIDDGAQVSVTVTDGCASTSAAAVRLSVLANPNTCTGGLDGQESPNGGSRILTDIGPVRWMAPEALNGRERENGFGHDLGKERGGVHGHSGEYTRTEIDLQVAGRGFDFVMSRVYRSRELRDGNLGPQWRHGYDRRVSSDPVVPGNVLLHDGTTSRVDSYAPSPTLADCFEAPGFFRTLCLQPDGRYVLTLPDLHEWIFSPLDGTPQQGAIEASVDRNGNAMLFQYDAGGALQTIVDTLGRPFTFSYDAAGRLERLTDFIGRSVLYDYYQVGENGGSPGDLKSVTSPSVIGTPHGNDFPNGKTTTYSYTSGFTDARLNHNLRSVGDGRGGVWMYVRYGATELPADGRYDRVSQVVLHPDCEQVNGTCDPTGQTISYVYAELPVDSAVPSAVSSTVVTDRAGNVTRYDYDISAHLIRERRHTGRATVVDAPSDTLSNPPVNPLRATDPPTFDTFYSYNAASQLILLQPPNQSTVQFFYDFLHPDPRLRGRVTERRTSPGPLGGSQSQIQELWTYGDPFGRNPVPCLETEGLSALDDHAAGFAATYTDGRGLVTTYDYDANGNVTLRQSPLVVSGTLGGAPQSVRETMLYNGFGQLIQRITPSNRVDTYSYYSSGSQAGYLESETIDGPILALTSTYEYDAVGNPTRITDPRGNSTQLVYNALDQIVRVIEPAPFLYETDYWYDAANRLVRVDRLNVDETGALRVNGHLSDGYAYDGLDRVTRSSSELEGSSCVVEHLEYDPNDNVTRLESGEAASGRQPDNVVVRLYDERDLTFQVVRAPGAVNQSTTEYDYDANGNLAGVRSGLESPTGGHVSSIQYDGYDRWVLHTDAEGNTLSRDYDANGNVVHERIDGELNQGSGSSVRLHERSSVYDELDRRVSDATAHFTSSSGAPVGDGSATVTTFYDADDRVLRREDDNGNGVDFVYDSARRLFRATDELGNSRTTEYDANSNPIRTTHVDLSGLGLPDQTFVFEFTFDALDRHVVTTDNAGNRWELRFDSQHDRVVSVDPLDNVIRTAYDGLHRPLSSVRERTDSGNGAGNLVDTTESQYEWDDNHRLRLFTDDNGNVTTYDYDDFDSLVRVDHADGTVMTFDYDVHRNRVATTDSNGTVTARAYDGLDRLVSSTVNRAAGVGGTTFELFEYDGLSRLRRAEDDDTVVTFAYDSLGNLVEESQQVHGAGTLSTSQSFDGASNLLQRVYPGGRTVDYVYDGLDRIVDVRDGATSLASYIYLGPSRIELQNYASGASSQFEYDSVGRRTRSLHRVGAIPALDIGALWDPLDNLLGEQDNLVPGSFIDYAYDSLYRLTDSARNAPGPVVSQVSYAYDGIGNRTLVTGGSEAGNYTLDATLPNPGDFQCNQYTTTPRGARSYDANGATLSADDRVGLSYDFSDRLLEVTTAIGTSSYTYDALGRRLRVDNAFGTRLFGYSGGAVIEEQDAAGVSQVTYVDGAGQLVQIREETDQNFDAVLDSYSVHLDHLGSVRGLSTAAGGLVERYEYDDFGTPEVFDGAGLSLGSRSPRGNAYLFRSHRWDFETRLYSGSGVYIDPAAGRPMTREGTNPLYSSSGGWQANPIHEPGLYSSNGGGSGGSVYVEALRQRDGGGSLFGVESTRRGTGGITGHPGGGAAGQTRFGGKKGYDHYVSRHPAPSPDSGNRSVAAQDYNSSRSNNGRSSVDAQDYNSSRSNNGRSVAAQDYNSSRSNNGRSVAAQDYNSSRSNNGRSAAAQDYNSSRSNNGSSAAAQDYNSSRSNNGGGRAPAQDYNSSRSNNGRSSVDAQDYNSSRSNNINAVAAQDYNSSRSNNGSAICCDDGAGGVGRVHLERVIHRDIATRNMLVGAAPGSGRGVAGHGYNSSRSNNINGVADVPGGGSGGGERIALDGADYNSSRSNNAGAIAGPPGGGGGGGRIFVFGGTRGHGGGGGRHRFRVASKK